MSEVSDLCKEELAALARAVELCEELFRVLGSVEAREVTDPNDSHLEQAKQHLRDMAAGQCIAEYSQRESELRALLTDRVHAAIVAIRHERGEFSGPERRVEAGAAVEVFVEWLREVRL